MSRLPLINITNYRSADWNDNESYFPMVFATYCDSYCCGISIQDLTPPQSVHPIITSLVRYHMYYKECKVVKECQIYLMSLMWESYIEKLNIPRKIIYHQIGGVVYQFFKETYKHDYKYYIPVKLDGFMKIGIQYLNQSIESYLYKNMAIHIFK